MRDTLIVLGVVLWIFSMFLGVNQKWLARTIGSAMIGIGIFFAQIIATIGSFLIILGVFLFLYFIGRAVLHAFGLGRPRHRRPPYDPYWNPNDPSDPRNWY